ncbi:MAG: preprotein translocase subunit YajC [Alicyclobacillus sp. RIFOXYA1_FULL_53_8]|nr:MAG: preprotein translocase subunit YajC [Alicyclobacillus sp. RIFOXYA1_FULL_53_8]
MKLGNIFLLLVLLGVFYALLILPQRRQQKQRATMMQKLAPGAKILTAGGMYAMVVAIHDSGLTATIADGIQVELDNRAVLRVVEAAPSSDVNPDLESDVSRDAE